MKAFSAPLRELGEFEEIEKRLLRNRGVLQVTGCIDSQKSHFIHCLGDGFSHKIIAASSDLRAKEIYENYKFFDRKVLLYPAKDFIFFQADIHSNLLERQRVEVLRALVEESDVTVIVTMAAFMNHLMPFEAWKKQIIRLENGSALDLDEMKKKLVELGYERNVQVEGPGQFAVRGGILDIFPLTEETPVRIELWGDEIDSIRSFDAGSQRSIENLDSVSIYPASELILEPEVRKRGLKKIEDEAKKQEEIFRKGMHTEEAYRIKTLAGDCHDRLVDFEDASGLDGFLDYFYSDTVSVLDYFPKDTVIFLDEPNRMAESAEASEQEFRESMQHRLEKGYVLGGQTGLLFSCQQMIARLSGQNCVGLCTLENARGSWKVSGKYDISVRAVNPYNNSFEVLVKDLLRWKKDGYRVILLAASRTRGNRLAEDLLEQGLNAFYSEEEERLVSPGEILVTYGNTHRGYEYPMIRFVVISESDIFGKEKKKRKKQKNYE
ncbi:MAG: transcription-repair coupling factor, partial [Lachnospiraceae bacterium]|nr:transcription-repair coupling factor [Lachnospiraceae bacterium]